MMDGKSARVKPSSGEQTWIGAGVGGRVSVCVGDVVVVGWGVAVADGRVAVAGEVGFGSGAAGCGEQATTPSSATKKNQP